MSNLSHVTKLLIPMKNLWGENYIIKLISYLILKLSSVSTLYFHVLRDFSVWNIIYSIDWPNCFNFSRELCQIVLQLISDKFRLIWFHIVHKIQGLRRYLTCSIDITRQISWSLFRFSHHYCPWFFSLRKYPTVLQRITFTLLTCIVKENLEKSCYFTRAYFRTRSVFHEFILGKFHKIYPRVPSWSFHFRLSFELI